MTPSGFTMEMTSILYLLALPAVFIALKKLRSRLILSSAKHPSLAGHSRLARMLARFIPFYGYDDARFFCSDGAAAEIAQLRRTGFERLGRILRERSPATLQLTSELRNGLSDLQFTGAYRTPFQYRNTVSDNLRLGAVFRASSGNRIQDLDGNWFFDLAGSYGVNAFGYDFYKACIDEGMSLTRDLGPVLGSYHPIVADNVERLKAVSGLDEVSFHMSGTEAVMQAVRLARFHTDRSHLVRFCGAYHGWWDGVQPGIGSDRHADDIYTLKEMDADSLKVLEDRKDIACVLVNPLQALHPNANAPGDGMLINSARRAGFDRKNYSRWLESLRAVCTRKSIVLIFDEVFVGFRLSYGGAQEYFGVNADLVTYGKTVGGGLPVGVVCGKYRLMRRFREDRPSQFSFARGTFNSHPLVMGAMNAFLRRIDTADIRNRYVIMDRVWNQRADLLNQRLAAEDLPIGVANLNSIWTVTYRRPSRYNWMFQYYLRAEGLYLSWVGTGRFIFSHDLSDSDFEAIMQRFVAAARAMDADGWWWSPEHLTDRAIRRQILREILAQKFGRKARPPADERRPTLETNLP
jgi:glutamate-1-semialdehyde 2,1-aminomutase